MSEKSGSRIFIGYRALGYVCNHVPLVTRYIQRRKEHLIVTAVGRVFHTYGGAKLGLLSVSKIHPEDISCLAADAFLVFAAAGNIIYAWRRGSELKHTYKGHNSTIVGMATFGPQLLSVDKASVVKIWNIKNETMVTEIEFPLKSFEVTCMMHPATYINKMVFGSKQGSLQLWNIRTCKKIYKFRGWKSSVLCLEQAPAIDVVAIGLENGEIYVHNLKYDETVVKFSQDWGPVNCLSFRTDGHPVMISSGGPHLALWDLEERKMLLQMRNSHCDEIVGAKCLQGEPLMVTSSPDNTLKQWIFDMPDGGGRLLRIKEGHAKPPTKIRFYGESGCHILSAGEDSSLRSFSTVTDLLNKSFGIASYNRKLSKKHKQLENPVKMNPIIDFTTETTRDRDWDNIACVHRDTTIVTTWSFGHQKMGSLQLRHERFKTDKTLLEARATCLCLSVCGNFVIIGYSSGHVDRYNIQSGIYRGSFCTKNQEEAHPKRRIRKICSDGLNQIVVTGDHKGGLKFWRFQTREFMARMMLESEIVHMELHRNSGLLAISLQDFSIVVLDIVTRNVVRKFEGHSNEISDFAFSADSRWIVSASLDSTCKVWDLPTGNLIDHFKFSRPVSSVTFSPRGDFLATSHVDDLGIFLWTNLTLYSHVSLRPLDSTCVPQVIQMPMSTTSAAIHEGKEDAEERADDDMEVDEFQDEFVSPDQLAEDLITLANLPSSRWQNLLKLDVIKMRNKPKDAVKKPTNAPFFLPTVGGLETKFDVSSQSGIDPNESKIISSKPLEMTAFARQLLKCETSEDFKAAMTTLEEKGPASLEVELISLGPEGGGTVELLVQFLVMIRNIFERRTDFEAAQAYLALFMKLHADTIIENAELSSELEKVSDLHESTSKELMEPLNTAIPLIAFYRNNVVN